MDFFVEFSPITIQPQEIELKSFEMIEEEIGNHSFSEEQFPIVKRVIHTTADFELGRSLRFHPEAVKAGIFAIRQGKKIVTDVEMVKAGIHQSRITHFGGQIICHIRDEDIVKEAKEQNITRSILAMQKATSQIEGGIFAIGNAPTALLELIRLVKLGKAKPDLIIGVPVGFVSAKEAKEELQKLDVPYITNQGRKGGSPVAAAIVNALSLMAQQVNRDENE
ncbi:precorrin-8X methylmutase [Tepidibacillus fermentans]|nr:precorrin-8X methylmutase [Tepidibacillus fermentans]